MSDLNDNLTRLSDARDDIAEAIVNKGGTVGRLDGFEDFSTDIASITNQYTIADEGKVVSGGSLIAQTAYPSTITENGTYNTTENNSVTVNVSSGIEMCELIKSSGLGGEMYAINTEDRTIVAGLLYKAGSYSSILLTFPQGFTPSYTKSPYGAWSVYYDYGYGSPKTFNGVNITNSSITFTADTLKGLDNSSQAKQIPICIQFTNN